MPTCALAVNEPAQWAFARQKTFILTEGFVICITKSKILRRWLAKWLAHVLTKKPDAHAIRHLATPTTRWRPRGSGRTPRSRADNTVRARGVFDRSSRRRTQSRCSLATVRRPKRMGERGFQSSSFFSLSCHCLFSSSTMDGFRIRILEKCAYQRYYNCHAQTDGCGATSAWTECRLLHFLCLTRDLRVFRKLFGAFRVTFEAN